MDTEETRPAPVSVTCASLLLVTPDDGLAVRVDELLQQAGISDCEVSHVPDLGRAMPLIKNRSCQLVLLHCQGPEPGAEQRALCQDNHGLPVAVLVDRAVPDTMISYLEAGFLDVLPVSELSASGLARLVLFSLARYERERHGRAEKRRLVQELEMSRSLVENNPDGILVLSQEGEIRLLNPSAVAILGRTKNELVGRPFGAPVLPGHTVDVDIVRAGGETGVARMLATEITWDGDLAYLGVLRDVSHQVQRMRELEDQLERERLVTRVATIFATGGQDVASAVAKTLKCLGRFVRADRCYLWLSGKGPEGLGRMCEWAGPDVPSAVAQLETLELDRLEWWKQRLEVFGTVMVVRTQELPEEAGAEREFLAARDVNCALAVAVRNQDGICGFLAVELLDGEHVWPEATIGLLGMVSGIMAPFVS